MAVPIGVVAILTVAAITMAVAILVLFLDFEQRVHRAFALFLVLRAMMDGMLLVSLDAGLGFRLRTYWLIAVPFAALHFCLAYRRRHGRQTRNQPQWFAPLAILAAALVVEALYLADHGMYGTPEDPGPLISFESLRFLAYAAVAWVFAAEYSRTQSTAGRRALVLASVGFALTPLYFCTTQLADLYLTGRLAFSASPVYFVMSLLLVADAGRRFLQHAKGGTRLVVMATLGACVLAAVATVVLFGTVSVATSENVLQTLFALTALAVPVCITYALVRHRLFDIDVRLRFAIRGTTLAAIFLAVFFIVNKVTENLVAARFENDGVGVYVGGAVAGLLLFALNPLQKLSDRIAQKAVPKVPGGLSAADRAQLYREQLEIAWRDGRLTPKERLLFTQLQQRLGLPAEEATRLENEVLQALAGPGGKRRPAAPA